LEIVPWEVELGKIPNTVISMYGISPSCKNPHLFSRVAC